MLDYVVEVCLGGFFSNGLWEGCFMDYDGLLQIARIMGLSVVLRKDGTRDCQQMAVICV